MRFEVLLVYHILIHSKLSDFMVSATPVITSYLLLLLLFVVCPVISQASSNTCTNPTNGDDNVSDEECAGNVIHEQTPDAAAAAVAA